MLTVLLIAVPLLALVIADFRWLRVMQREHYIPGSSVTVALRWARKRPPNQVLAPAGALAALLALFGRPYPVALGAAVAAFPVGMPLLAREQRLVRTPRLTRLAACTLVLQALIAAAVISLGAPGATAVLAAAVPVVIDAAALAMRPVEARLARKYRTSAQATLSRVGPRVIAVTGSFGKTSTKNHIADLLTGSFDVVASPASYNNDSGLCRTVNQHLRAHTQVLVAEMGTYGPGEIRAMCSWVKPEIGIITAIGPMHLERMKTLYNVVRAKSEILEEVRVAILNVDDERLAELADTVNGPEDRRGESRARRRRPARAGGRQAGRALGSRAPSGHGRGRQRDRGHRRHLQLQSRGRRARPGDARSRGRGRRRGRGRQGEPPGRGHPGHGRARPGAGRGEPGVRRGGYQGRRRAGRGRLDQPARADGGGRRGRDRHGRLPVRGPELDQVESRRR